MCEKLRSGYITQSIKLVEMASAFRDCIIFGYVM